MESSISNERRGPGIWRIIGWGGAASILIVPAVAMQVTDEVGWSAFDFAFAAGMVAILGGLFELAIRQNQGRAYRFAAGLSLLASMLIVWLTGAVGIVGNEDDPFNLLFFFAIAAMVGGAAAAKGSPDGLKRACWAAFALQLLIGLLGVRQELILIPVTAAFCAIWAASAYLFGVAARDRR